MAVCRELQSHCESSCFCSSDTMRRVRDMFVTLIHLFVTLVRLSKRVGSRSVVAESVLIRHQLLIHKGPVDMIVIDHAERPDAN
jgi:hypothetical protein